MASNVFNELANRFSEYEQNPDVNIEAVAAEAAQTVYNALISNQLGIKAERPERKLFPIHENPLENLQDASEVKILDSLLHYWWYILLWIGEDFPDAKHVFKSDEDDYEHGAAWIESWSKLFGEEITFENNPDEYRKIWLSIAKASIRACLFIAQNFKGKSPFAVDEEHQRLIYNNKALRFPGLSYWELFLFLYKKDGLPATSDELRPFTNGEINVLIGDLKRHLIKLGSEGEVIAKAIKNQRCVGYYFDSSEL